MKSYCQRHFLGWILRPELLAPHPLTVASSFSGPHTRTNDTPPLPQCSCAESISAATKLQPLLQQPPFFPLVSVVFPTRPCPPDLGVCSLASLGSSGSRLNHSTFRLRSASSKLQPYHHHSWSSARTELPLSMELRPAHLKNESAVQHTERHIFLRRGNETQEALRQQNPHMVHEQPELVGRNRSTSESRSASDETRATNILEDSRISLRGK